MNAEKYLLEKCDNLIKFLSEIKTIKENEAAFAKLPSFRDLPWIISYCKDTFSNWQKDPERCLSNLIVACCLKDEDFTKEERQKFAIFLSLFMEVTESVYK